MTFPLSAKAYMRERKACTGEKVWLSKDRLRQFRELDRTLVGQGIDPDFYIVVSAGLWLSWSKERGMPFVPINVICGEKAIQRFIELDPITPDEEHAGWVSYYEQGAAQATVRCLIQGHPKNQIQETLMAEWYPEWWEADKKKRPELHRQTRKKAAEFVAFYYNVALEFEDYEHIAQQVLERRATIPTKQVSRFSGYA